MPSNLKGLITYKGKIKYNKPAVLANCFNFYSEQSKQNIQYIENLSDIANDFKCILKLTSRNIALIQWDDPKTNNIDIHVLWFEGELSVLSKEISDQLNSNLKKEWKYSHYKDDTYPKIELELPSRLTIYRSYFNKASINAEDSEDNVQIFFEEDKFLSLELIVYLLGILLIMGITISMKKFEWGSSIIVPLVISAIIYGYKYSKNKERIHIDIDTFQYKSEFSKKISQKLNIMQSNDEKFDDPE